MSPLPPKLEATRTDRVRRDRAAAPDWNLIVVTIGSAVAFIALALFSSPGTPGARLCPPCLLHEITGLYCPGCGATRAVRALLHGNLLAAWHLNPLLILFIPVLVVLIISERVTRRPLGHSPVVTWGILVVVIVFGVLRNIPLSPFTVLAPH